MRPTASSPTADAAEPETPGDAAFTLAEMAASLVVAAMLVSGLAEITRQFARTTVRVRAALEETRDARLAQAELAGIERADPGEVRVSSERVEARIGEEEVRFTLTAGATEGRRLTWTWGNDPGADAGRTIVLGEAARFEQGPDGVVRLWAAPGEPPLLVAAPRRDAPFDCQYDVVVRDCR